MTRLLTNLRSSMRTLLCASLLLWMSTPANAQRFMDNLGRGLVAIPENNSNYITWRRLGTEYYDVTYNLYKNGSLLASGLTTTNYSDSQSATSDTQYQVAAVVGGVEQKKCTAVKAWTQYDSNSCTTGYIDIPMAAVYDRDGNDVTSHYEPNDAEFADLDGDGELEMIIKRLNTVDAAGVSTGTYASNGTEIFNIYPKNSKEFVVLDAYDINWQTGAATLMWRIDCGPNMVSSNSTEINIIAFDWWKKDGKAEVVLRGADNMIIHYKEKGIWKTRNIGNMNVNTRQNWMSHRQSDGRDISSMAYTNDGAEYLLYLNGETGELYQQMDYPLKRLEAGESDLNAAWGDGYGHRSSKYFFGVPYLNGQEPTLFMARGIYTRHKMMVMYLDYQNKWAQLWTWNNNTSGSPWYGQGYHNFIIADVDEDGRDEIVYGSMVIDDNFQGLSTTGLGHGDAQHVGDFDPYRPGLEFFGCNEDNPAMNYRNATTSEIYIRRTASNDDGRGLMANFSNSYPGSLGRSVTTGMLSSVKDKEIEELGDSYIAWSDLNFRIYWDGDLCSEILNSPGTAKEAKVDKPGIGRLFTSSDCKMNNDSKNNPCFQGDLIGDWREEIVVRCGTNVRIYTSGMETNYSIPTLWHDHQYRQAMVWQMMAYNQPPHLSYFLGEMEGYTQAPPPLITNGREIVSNGANIDGSYNGKHVLHNEYGNTSISMGNGTPAVLTINVPAWVQGHGNNNNITTETYKCDLTGGAMSGTTRLVKQGNGILNMSNAVHTNSGNTDIWGGTVNFDGTMQNSPVWMNRHTTLNTNDGYFNNGLTMEYGATLNVGGTQVGNCSRVNISELTLNYGALVVLDVNGSGDAEHDWLNASTLKIDDSKVGIDAWENYGPKYIVPVFKLNMASPLGNGRYPIGNVTTVNGDLSKVKIECNAIDARYLSLFHEGGILYLQVSDVATATEATIEITGMAPYETVSTLYPSASSDNYYLPVVSIVANNTNGQVPTLSGTFTSLDGTVTNIGSNEEVVLFSENFENSSTPGDYWKNGNGGIYSPTYTNSDGKCIGIVSSADRGDYTSYNIDYTGVKSYQIDFDAFFNNASKTTDFAVMSKSHAASWVYNFGYNWITTSESRHNPFLFFLRRGEGTTTFTVNESTTTLILNNSTWYHFTLNVNVLNGTVDYNISQKGSASSVARGTYTLPDGESAECDGFYIRNGRYNYEPGGAGIDNIVIKSSGNDMSSYTFTEPGTLQVTSDVEGYASGIKTFEVKYPYFKLYESPDFSTLAAADATTMLGSDFWSGSTSESRWANWNSNNTYTMVTAKRANKMYVDSEKVLWANIKEGHPGNRLLTLIEGYGIGQTTSSSDSDGNSGTVFHATELGDENTIIYHKYDLSRGYTPKTYIEEYIHADENGNYDYDSGNNFTLQKFIAYVPVAIHDELATNLPQTVSTTGNAHVWRQGMAGVSTWATMVVPFEMTVAQVREVFGDEVTVANLETGKGNGSQIYFETIDVATASDATIAITANKPCLMKGVTKSAPYLIMGITTEPAQEPSVSNGHFTFVGTYTDLGQKAFTTNDYFFTTSGLSRVETNGTTMRLKGYRGYFQGLTANGAKSIKTVFEESDVVTGILDVPTIMRNDVYDLQGRKIPENWQRKKGVYIVNGRKMIVK